MNANPIRILAAAGAVAMLLAAAGAAALPQAAKSAPDFKSRHIAFGLHRTEPAFAFFSVDSLGGGRVAQNPVLPVPPSAKPVLSLEKKSAGVFVYAIKSVNGAAKPLWTVNAGEKAIVLRSEYSAGTAAAPFVLTFDQKKNHATLLGRMKAGERAMALPCLLHLPDMGSIRISSPAAGGSLDYDARRYVDVPFVRVAFPAATAERPLVEYRLEAAAIHPLVRGAERNPLYDGFRRSFLNLFQVNPRVQMLANNASSDPVPFTLYMDSMIALSLPPLAEGLTAMDLVRMTLDRYLSGAKGYGLVGYAIEKGDADLVAWKAPWNSLDTYPSLLLAACDVILGAGDLDWGKANFGELSAMAWGMMAADRDGNGLIEHPHSGNSGDRATADRRPSNWWDTINFGHEDAYANALAYRACLRFSEAARKLDKNADADAFAAKAVRLRAAYKSAFLNPATGILAGWRSRDGKLHDYYFTFVNGIAVTFGLLDRSDANAIMGRILTKMRQVGFTAFRYGLPGNLIPIRMSDYVFHNWAGAREIGEPFREDGTDAFQIYENGGATACYAYFTVKALYDLGRVADARRIFYPMLQSYARGDFQGFCDNKKSKDWRDWSGGCHGYEGLLTDGFLGLLAVLDDAKPGR